MNPVDEVLLDCRAVSKTFSIDGLDLKAVDTVDLQVRAGEKILIQGPSGSGKTTLLMIAAGMLVPSSGTINFIGQDHYQRSSDERCRMRRKEIGVVLPMFHLLPYLNAIENIALGYRGPDRLQRATSLLDRIGLIGRERQMPNQMSGGERRRLVVARALLHEPQLLFADEPTSNLDGDHAAIVGELLSERAASGGGVVVITHQKIPGFEGDRSFRMERGRLAAM